jgi:hypothetical protein
MFQPLRKAPSKARTETPQHRCQPLFCFLLLLLGSSAALCLCCVVCAFFSRRVAESPPLFIICVARAASSFVLLLLLLFFCCCSFLWLSNYCCVYHLFDRGGAHHSERHTQLREPYKTHSYTGFSHKISTVQ